MSELEPGPPYAGEAKRATKPPSSFTQAELAEMERQMGVMRAAGHTGVRISFGLMDKLVAYIRRMEGWQ